MVVVFLGSDFPFFPSKSTTWEIHTERCFAVYGGMNVVWWADHRISSNVIGKRNWNTMILIYWMVNFIIRINCHVNKPILGWMRRPKNFKEVGRQLNKFFIFPRRDNSYTEQQRLPVISRGGHQARAYTQFSNHQGLQTLFLYIC